MSAFRMEMELPQFPPLRCSVFRSVDGGPHKRCESVARHALVTPPRDDHSQFTFSAFCRECWESYQRSKQSGTLEVSK